MRASLGKYNPFPSGIPDVYAAWHIRTPDGDTELSFIPAVHKYVVTEPSSVVCPSYLTALATVQTKCGLEPYTPVYVASNR